jgi:hypothetical protein
MGRWEEEWFPPRRTKDRALSVAHCKPLDLNDIEARSIAEHDRFAGRSKKFPTLFGTETEDAIRIRTSLANFARAALEREPGEAFLRLAMCLEGLLVSASGDNTARVSEAAAHYLGGPRARREDMRKLVVDLYDARSQYVHAGRLEAPSPRKRSHAKLLEESSSLVRELLRREIRELPDLTPEADGTGSAHPPD